MVPGAAGQARGTPLYFKSPFGRGAGLVSWRTTIEYSILGFNIVVIDNQGARLQQNDALIPCLECTTGSGASYEYPIPKHRSGRSIFIEMVHLDGVVHAFGPAQRDP